MSIPLAPNGVPTICLREHKTERNVTQAHSSRAHRSAARTCGVFLQRSQLRQTAHSLSSKIWLLLLLPLLPLLLMPPLLLLPLLLVPLLLVPLLLALCANWMQTGSRPSIACRMVQKTGQLVQYCQSCNTVAAGCLMTAACYVL
jgi:hypothetical protein